MANSRFVYVTYIRTTSGETVAGADRPRIHPPVLV